MERAIEDTLALYLGAPDPADGEEAGLLMEKIGGLLELLNHAYYDLDSPLADDRDYDLLLRRLEELEARFPDLSAADSPARHVGGGLSEKFSPVPHPYPMLSLLDVFSREEVEDFVGRIQARVPGEAFLVEMKIDGLSISLTYEKGRLVRGVTRGDGVSFGEDVTENLLEIRAIPKVLAEAVEELSVRGEVFMPQRSFESLNRELEEEGKKLFANPRNAASGTIRQLDASVVRSRNLSFFAFEVQHASRGFRSDSESLDWLKSLGFLVIPELEKAVTAEEVMAAVDRIGEKRSFLPFGIDGAVIKLDRLDLRGLFGETVKYPRWSVAYKYPPEQKETQVLDITAEVGRTGRITPLAWLAPVSLAGTTVQRASLHNQNYIDQLDIRIGDTVLVQKGGDIIPAVISVNKEKRPEGTRPYQLPALCPACASPTEYKGGADLYCTYIDCPAQLVGHLVYFASKEAMDIDGLGGKAALALTEQGYVRSMADLYSLRDKRDELIESGIIGREKNVDKLLAEIELSKEQDPDRLLTGLGIPLVGRQTARALLSALPDIHEIAAADEDRLARIPDIGPATAGEIRSWFSRKEPQELLARLEAAGLRFSRVKEGSWSPLEGQSYVLTGTLSGMTRSEAKEALEALGARVSSSVSKNTKAVIAGDSPGSKAVRARELGITIMDEEEFSSWLSGLKKEGENA